MTHHRVYMSARLAAAGTVVATVTMVNYETATEAEDYIEWLNNPSGQRTTSDLRHAISDIWDNQPILFVYMKESVA